MSAVIDLSKVQFRWPRQVQPVLSINTLQIEAGERLFIRGQSGSGKTSLLNLLTGITVPQQGSIRLLDTDITQLSGRKRDQFRADHLGVIFQQFNLLPYLSLIENVQLPCWFSRTRRERAGNVDAESLRLLSELQLPNELLHRPVSDLSTGQQQRVAVARALIGTPEIIIADEPTSALDTDNRNRFLDLLFAQAEHHGSTLIFVSHDPVIAERFHRVVDLAQINHQPNTESGTQASGAAI